MSLPTFSASSASFLFAGKLLGNMERVSEGPPEVVPVGESTPDDAEDVPVSKEAAVVADEAPIGDEAAETPEDEQLSSSDDPDKEACRVGVQLSSALCRLHCRLIHIRQPLLCTRRLAYTYFTSLYFVLFIFKVLFSWCLLYMWTCFVVASTVMLARTEYRFALHLVQRVYSYSLMWLFVSCNEESRVNTCFFSPRHVLFLSY